MLLFTNFDVIIGAHNDMSDYQLIVVVLQEHKYVTYFYIKSTDTQKI